MENIGDTKFAKLEADNEELVEERNIPGTLFSMQIIRLKSGQCLFRCKPLAGSNLIDLIGQPRTGKDTKISFTADDRILVSSANRILIFDDKGYYLGRNNYP